MIKFNRVSFSWKSDINSDRFYIDPYEGKHIIKVGNECVKNKTNKIMFIGKDIYNITKEGKVNLVQNRLFGAEHYEIQLT
tara:strand:- start:571 stop:810 length:240 start_codon:yes stop_codon:yes gene_type:complete